MSQLEHVTPQLRITQWDRSRAFYVVGLGFHVDWEHRFEENFPVFAQLTRDGISIFLTEHEGDCKPGGAVYFVVTDINALHQEFTEQGLTPEQAPEATPWGTREMTIRDPDGNRLPFSSRAE